jgi:hypothetical protein
LHFRACERHLGIQPKPDHSQKERIEER